jgi:copper(I)-binding protein
MTETASLGRRLAGAARSALAPVAASALALGCLTVWSASGAAGSPARIQVSEPRVVLPLSGDQFTVAVFRIRNSGDTDDELLSVTSPAVGRGLLARTELQSDATGATTGATSMLGSMTVPARTTVAMSPHGLEVVLNLPSQLHAGERIPFVLNFRRSGRVETTALVARTGD